MGLKYPRDLRAWSQWQASQHRLIDGVRRLRPRQATQQLTLEIPADGHAQLLVALDVAGGPKVDRLLAPLEGLAIATLSVQPISNPRPGMRRVPSPVMVESIQSLLPSACAVISHGHYEAAGFAGHRWAEQNNHAQLIVQHGLLTPFQPPLPTHAHLMAWSAADAQFWVSGRSDVTATVVGSQMLQEAASQLADRVSIEQTPTYLGQLHGAELPRRGMARAALTFCRDNDATYRPHPSEIDKLSRLQHSLWERRGINIDRSGTPLREHNGPVVAAFSTGVLEAAARGVPSFVHYPGAPMWLEEFWDRYGMKQWGGSPTPAPWTGTDPAAAIRAAVLDVIGRTTG